VVPRRDAPPYGALLFSHVPKAFPKREAARRPRRGEWCPGRKESLERR